MAIQIPHELAENLRKGRVVLFVGSGMSQPQLPGWRGLLERMMQQADRDGISVASNAKSEIDQLVANNELLTAAGKVRQVLDTDFHGSLKRVLMSSRPAPAAAHKLLPSLRLRAILTTNYDRLIESVYLGDTSIYVHAKVPALNEDFFIWKLHGDVLDPDSIVFDENDYDNLAVNPRVLTVLDGLFQQNMVLFVGYSLKDPDLLLVLKRLATILKQQTGPHFALMQTNGMPQWERDRFRNHYRIRIFGDDARVNVPDIEGYLRKLRDDSFAFLAVLNPTTAEKIKEKIQDFRDDLKSGRYDLAWDYFQEHLNRQLDFELSDNHTHLTLLLNLFNDHPDNDPPLTSPENKAAALNALGRAYKNIGQPLTAVEIFNRQLALNAGSAETRVIALANLANVLRLTGQLSKAEQVARKMLEAAAKSNLPRWRAYGLYWNGVLCAGRGAVNEGLVLLRQAQVLFEDILP